MLRIIICLNYDNVIVFKVCLFREKVIIEKYLKEFANEVADSNNNPHHLRFLSVWFHNLNKSKTCFKQTVSKSYSIYFITLTFHKNRIKITFE